MVEEGKGIICPYCGAISKEKPTDGYYRCDYCGNIYFEDIQECKIDFKEAKNEIKLYNFVESDERYSDIIKNNSDNKKVVAMALLGRLLAQFGVVYVRSFNKKYFVPTFAKYNPRYESIKETS